MLNEEKLNKLCTDNENKLWIWNLNVAVHLLQLSHKYLQKDSSLWKLMSMEIKPINARKDEIIYKWNLILKIRKVYE